MDILNAVPDPDPSLSRLFISGAKQTSVPGAISGIKGTVLPMVYTDGQHITCSLIVAPHKK